MDHDQSVRVIKRYNSPNKLDTANYLTLCQVGYEGASDNMCDYYIQISKNEEIPNWIDLGSLRVQLILDVIDLIK